MALDQSDSWVNAAGTQVNPILVQPREYNDERPETHEEVINIT